MSEEFNIYCDESCHLENDRQTAMVLGAVWCPTREAKNVARRIRDIKRKHGFHPRFEIKWTKVSTQKLDFYKEILDYFFDDDDLHFRCLIVPDKSLLDHSKFSNKNHDAFYYRMYYVLLNRLLAPHERYRIFIDIKDTQGGAKIKNLHDVLCSAHLDFNRNILKTMQLVHSNEVAQSQLADLLIGCVSSANRTNTTSEAKLSLVSHAKRRSGYSLQKTTLLREQKFNVFRWRAQESQ